VRSQASIRHFGDEHEELTLKMSKSGRKKVAKKIAGNNFLLVEKF
jgi:hypothetical protein